MTTASNPIANNQDPLAELRPLELPTSIDAWPWAPGWYFLMVLLVVTLSLSVFFIVRHRRNTLYKRQALSKLADIKQGYQHEQDIAKSAKIAKSAEAVSKLLKQICLVHFPREDISQLSGDAWLTLLDRLSRSTEFTQGSGSLMGTRLFTPLEKDHKAEQDLAKLFKVSEKFIKELKPKQIKLMSKKPYPLKLLDHVRQASND